METPRPAKRAKQAFECVLMPRCQRECCWNDSRTPISAAHTAWQQRKATENGVKSYVIPPAFRRFLAQHVTWIARRPQTVTGRFAMNFRDDEFSLPSLSGVAERLSHPSNPRSAASHPTNTPVRAVPLPGLAHQSVVATPSPVSHVPVLGIPPVESAIDGPATVRTLLSARRRSSPRLVPVVTPVHCSVL